MSAQSKTEKPTAKKRRDERKEGNVFQSKDVTTIGFLLVAFLAISISFPNMYSELDSTFESFFYLISTDVELTHEFLQKLGWDLFFTAVICALPIAIACMVAAIILTGIQTRFLFSAKSLKPKLKKLSPIEGIKKIFSLKNLVELFKNIIKIVILTYVVYSLLLEYIPQVIRMMNMEITTSAALMADMGMDLIMRVVMVFTVVAFADYLFQRWDHERKLMMTKQEVKEEFKQLEGNPEIKGKIKNMQRQRSRSRMIQAVPSADVVIRNPTHYAVALKYDRGVSPAPIVVAMGQDSLALRIIQVANENEVTVVENVPLARALYASCELNREITSEHYTAVAEVLAYVYKLNNKMR